MLHDPNYLIGTLQPPVENATLEIRAVEILLQTIGERGGNFTRYSQMLNSLKSDLLSSVNDN